MRRITPALLCLLITSPALADNWPNWRGPANNGVAPGRGYPTKWSATENIAWKVALPGKGTSTPVVWGDSIFVTCSLDSRNLLVCLDGSGRERWRVGLGEERKGKNAKASGSNPSPVTDGTHVFAYFKSGDFACVDFAGTIVWQKNLQKLYGDDTLWWDLGTSPVLTKETIVVACMHSGPSYVAAFKKGTGEVAWKHDRNLDAPEEAAQSYSTPVLLADGGRETLIILGADHVTAHDAATGREIWRVGGLNPTGHKYYRSIASPAVSNGVVVAPYARATTITGIRLGGGGDVTATHVAWKKDGLGTDVPTPVALNGKVYVCTDKGEVACLDIQTGTTLWSGVVEKHRTAFSSSPVIADGRIYVTREDGKTFVLEQGNEFKVISENELGEQTVASPAFVDGQILIRTFDSLYCIGRPTQAANR
jgi:outer membrane protein assembly factor BamB